MNKRGPVGGQRPADSYERILQSHSKAAKRLVEGLRRRYFDVEGKSESEITDLVVRGEIYRRPDKRAF